ncbi:MAG TPA: hypothetical protein PK280_16690, partial [Planctomycetota bacterium]|nr:hypothetical protein [Planctomycetota bacterium]
MTTMIGADSGSRCDVRMRFTSRCAENPPRRVSAESMAPAVIDAIRSRLDVGGRMSTLSKFAALSAQRAIRGNRSRTARAAASARAASSP